MTPRRSKLDWYKSLRGADLTQAEFVILVLLAGYSNASRENAYPGSVRLAADSGIDRRRVRRILKSLEAKKAIAVTEEGGNQIRKGAATVYMVLTPPQRSKGALVPPFKTTTVHPSSAFRIAPRGAFRAPRGAPPAQQGGHPRPPIRLLIRLLIIISNPMTRPHSLRKRGRTVSGPTMTASMTLKAS